MREESRAEGEEEPGEEGGGGEVGLEEMVDVSVLLVFQQLSREGWVSGCLVSGSFFFPFMRCVGFG